MLTDEQVITDTIEREGGGKFTNHPADRGGPTRWGVTAKTLGAYRKLGRAATSEEVEALSEPEARAIYRTVFIEEPGFGAIVNPLLRAQCVDIAVNHGAGRAVKWLQKAIGVEQDGAIGPKTREALDQIAPGVIYRRMAAARARAYGRLITDDPKQSVFAAGWMNRLAGWIEEAP